MRKPLQFLFSIIRYQENEGNFRQLELRVLIHFIYYLSFSVFEIMQRQIENDLRMYLFVNFVTRLNAAFNLLPQITTHIFNLVLYTALIFIIYDPTQSPIPDRMFHCAMIFFIYVLS